jgi:hypothetical protein
VFVKKIRQTDVRRVFDGARRRRTEEEEKKKMQKSLLSFLFRFLLLSYNKRIIPEQQSS